MKPTTNLSADMENCLRTVDPNKFKHSDVRRILKLARRLLEAEAEARRSAKAWEESAAQFARNEDYFRGLLDECAKHLGPACYVCDDGSISQDPLRAKIPELVAATAKLANDRLTAEVVPGLEKLRQEAMASLTHETMAQRERRCIEFCAKHNCQPEDCVQVFWEGNGKWEVMLKSELDAMQGRASC